MKIILWNDLYFVNFMTTMEFFVLMPQTRTDLRFFEKNKFAVLKSLVRVRSSLVVRRQASVTLSSRRRPLRCAWWFSVWSGPMKASASSNRLRVKKARRRRSQMALPTETSRTPAPPGPRNLRQTRKPVSSVSSRTNPRRTTNKVFFFSVNVEFRARGTIVEWARGTVFVFKQIHALEFVSTRFFFFVCFFNIFVNFCPVVPIFSCVFQNSHQASSHRGETRWYRIQACLQGWQRSGMTSVISFWHKFSSSKRTFHDVLTRNVKLFQTPRRFQNRRWLVQRPRRNKMIQNRRRGVMQTDYFSSL